MPADVKDSTLLLNQLGRGAGGTEVETAGGHLLIDAAGTIMTIGMDFGEPRLPID